MRELGWGLSLEFSLLLLSENTSYIPLWFEILPPNLYWQVKNTVSRFFLLNVFLENTTSRFLQMTTLFELSPWDFYRCPFCSKIPLLQVSFLFKNTTSGFLQIFTVFEIPPQVYYRCPLCYKIPLQVSTNLHVSPLLENTTSRILRQTI